MKEAQELHFFTIEIHGKKLVTNIKLPARFRGAELFMGQFRTIYVLLAGFVSLFVIAFFLFYNVSITVVYIIGYSDVCVCVCLCPSPTRPLTLRIFGVHLRNTWLKTLSNKVFSVPCFFLNHFPWVSCHCISRGIYFSTNFLATSQGWLLADFRTRRAHIVV